VTKKWVNFYFNEIKKSFENTGALDFFFTVLISAAKKITLIKNNKCPKKKITEKRVGKSILDEFNPKNNKKIEKAVEFTSFFGEISLIPSFLSRKLLLFL